jgi:hypothetical protein
MQFCSSLIHWGAITGDDEIRDLGIYLYVTEQSAIEEYWFDMHDRNFAPNHPYSLVSRVWGNGYDNGTFWTSDIAASYGIELYPIHGGSLYLGHNLTYASNLWTEMTQNTGILSNQENPNLWHDTYWKFQAFTDPEGAIALYDSYPDRELKFGMSDAQTYYWLHSMNAMGQVDVSVTADDPLATAFSKDGVRNYAAHNYSAVSKIVNFSDGESLYVPPYTLISSLDPRDPITNVVASVVLEGVGISWPTTDGTNYVIQWSSGLGTNAVWNSLDPVVEGDWTTKTVFDPDGPHANKFYRGIELP